MDESLLERARQIIGDATPIPMDCGKLCGSACCKDTVSHEDAYAFLGASDICDEYGLCYDDEQDEFGMLLFPGEEKLLRGEPGFKTKRIRYMSGHAWFMVCSGTCDRAKRPLACRIFPLAPYVRADGSLHALPDPRAARMCPLSDGMLIDRRFRGAVARALRLLAKDSKCLEFIKMLSAELVELRRLTG